MPEYLQFRVELKDIRPLIWREFQLVADGTFYDLHLAIQACGWFGGHLWSFYDSDGETIAGIPDDEYGRPDPDARQVPLSAFFDQAGTSCVYVYDFGDGWEHRVSLSKVVRVRERFCRRLLDGARRFPPEDCGGVPGYMRVVEFLATGKDPWGEPEHLREQIGLWTPEDFKLVEQQGHFADTSTDDLDASFDMI
jgi:hypothetical protein